ncbi:MAG: hypothetical protein DCC75_01075 [Proteobacteria bacterium]|nr:MAG: hypothetical protein DCC75_01075 [Pseudomonadota bacterium]
MTTPNSASLNFASLGSQVKRLEIKTRRMLSADLLGGFRTAFRGSGLVYSDLRDYQPGDEVRNIHWKASARSQRIYVKSYEEDRRVNILLVIDVSASTSFGAPRSKHLKALEFSALVSALALKNGDKLGLCLFADGVQEFISPKASRVHFHKVLYHLNNPQVLKRVSDLDAALAQLRKLELRQSIVFIVSDFICPPFEENLRLLNIKHDCICVMLEDDLDYELPQAGLVELEDCEAQTRIVVDTSSARGKQLFQALHSRHLERTAELCRRHRVDFVRLREKPVQALIDLMRARTRRGVR